MKFLKKYKKADRHGRLEYPTWFIIGTILGFVLSTISIFAVGIYNIEINAEGANVESLSDCYWLGLMTISTVGYGDHYAVTDLGRLLAAFLILIGPILLGAFFATGQGLIRTNANITGRELMTVQMEMLRILNMIQDKLEIKEVIDADNHGIDELIVQAPYESKRYSGWITLGKDNTGVFSISIVGRNKKDSRLPLCRHIYASDDYDYAWALFQHYCKDENLF